MNETDIQLQELQEKLAQINKLRELVATRDSLLVESQKPKAKVGLAESLAEGYETVPFTGQQKFGEWLQNVQIPEIQNLKNALPDLAKAIGQKINPGAIALGVVRGKPMDTLKEVHRATGEVLGQAGKQQLEDTADWAIQGMPDNIVPRFLKDQAFERIKNKFATQGIGAGSQGAMNLAMIFGGMVKLGGKFRPTAIPKEAPVIQPEKIPVMKSTEEAIVLGEANKGNLDLAKNLRDKYVENGKVVDELKAQGKFDEAMAKATEGQFYRESAEVIEGQPQWKEPVLPKPKAKPLEQISLITTKRELPKGKIKAETKLTPQEQLGALAEKPKPQEPSLFEQKQREFLTKGVEAEKQIAELGQYIKDQINRPDVNAQKFEEIWGAHKYGENPQVEAWLKKERLPSLISSPELLWKNLRTKPLKLELAGSDRRKLSVVREMVENVSAKGGTETVQSVFYPKFRRYRQGEEPPWQKSYQKSLYPEWWQGRGYDAKTVLPALTKVMEGKELTPKQYGLVKEILDITPDPEATYGGVKGGAYLYSGFPVTEAVKKVASEIKAKFEEATGLPKGTTIEGEPSHLSLGYTFKIPQNVFKDHPIGNEVRIKVRDAELGYAYDSAENIVKLDPLKKIKPEQGQAFIEALEKERTAFKDTGEYAKLSPDQQVAYDTWKAIADDYRQKLWQEQKDAGVPVPENWQDWGIGEYFTHLFRGNFKIVDNTTHQTIGFARDYPELRTKIQDLSKQNPSATFGIKYQNFVPDEVIVRLTPRHKWKLMSELAKQVDMSAEEVNALIKGKGIIALKPKQRYFGQVKHREVNLPGYETDVYNVARIYVAGAERYLKFNKMKRETQALMNKMPLEDHIVKKELESLIDDVQQAPTIWERNVDVALRKNPVTRLFVKPFFVRRSIGHITNFQNVFKLGNPRFLTQNASELLIRLYPIAGEKGLYNAISEFFTPEGQAKIRLAKLYPKDIAWTEGQLRDFMGDFGRAILKPAGKLEQFNQGTTYLGGLRLAEKLGIPEAQRMSWAIDFVERTQIPSRMSNSPVVMRKLLKTQVGRIPGQFKGYTFRYFENIMLPRIKDLVTGRDVPAGLRYVGAQALTGGLKLVTSPVAWTSGIFGWKLYNELKEAYGEKTARAFYFGFPSLLGADISSSLAVNVLWGTGNAYERIGQTLVGPAGSDAINIGRALKEGKWQYLEYTSPLVYMPFEAYRMISGKEQVTPTTGRQTYQFSPYEKVLKMSGIKPASQTVEQMQYKEESKITTERGNYRRQILQAYADGDRERVKELKDEWKKKYPHVDLGEFNRKMVREERLKIRQTRLERFKGGMSRRMRKQITEQAGANR